MADEGHDKRRHGRRRVDLTERQQSVLRAVVEDYA